MILMKQDWVKPNYADLAKQFNFNCKTVKKYFESSVENLKSTSLKTSILNLYKLITFGNIKVSHKLKM